MDIVSECLKIQRKHHKLTQQQVADYLHIHRSTYTYYETGKTDSPLSTIIALTSLYHVSADYLLGIKK